MLQRLIIITTSLLFYYNSFSQVYTVKIDTFCSYSPGTICGSRFELNFYELDDSLWIKKVVYQVLNELGINRKVFIGRFNDKSNSGIFFKLKEDNTARVLVAQQYVAQNWVALGILFHELGHYINDHENFCSNKNLELDADYYAGYCLSKAGASKGEAIVSLSILPKEGDDTHPSKDERQQRILKGWDDQRKSIGINSFISKKEIVKWIKNEKEVTVQIDNQWYHFKRPQYSYNDSVLAFDAQVGLLYIKSTNSTYLFTEYPIHKYWASSSGQLINNKTSLVYLRYGTDNLRVYDKGILIFEQNQKTEYVLDWVDIKHIDYYASFSVSGFNKTVIFPDFFYNRELKKAFPAFYR